MTKRISIITLCYNQLENATKPFIESLYKHTNADLFELIIVNNASSDGTYEYLEQIKTEKTNISVIHNNENGGYSKGNNQGMKIANGEYLFMLNNDVLFTPNWLENLVSILDQTPDIGIVAPITNFCGEMKQLVQGYNEFTIENYQEKIQKLNLNPSEILYNDKIIFFCWGMKRKVFEKVGYLDENFGLAWFEDDDYTLRVLYQGYKPAIAKGVFLFHNHSQTSTSLQKSEEGILLEAKNRKYFENKHAFYLNLKNKVVELENKLNRRKALPKKILQNVFSIKNKNAEKKIIKILGIKITIKR